MGRPILAALLALSLVLAGCNAIAFGGDETPTPRFTPAPVPTDKPTPTPVPQLTPGLTGEGVTDAFALAEAHSAVLDNISYTLHENSTVRYVNGTVFNQFTTHAQIAANDSRFFFIQNGLGINVRGSGKFSMWSNGERFLIARTSNNSTSYAVHDIESEPILPRDAFGFDPTSRERIQALFSSVETRVTGQETRNGTTLSRIVATNVTNPAAFRVVWYNPRNLTLVALVDSQGLVHEYRLNYTATLDNSTVRV
ncbi:MAG TPA: hypothetical protein VFJ06_12115, partial [Halococcus sp.]|nr:hypothetical protein [Halococcus sp.]